MQAASNLPQNTSLRNQLLSSDIGSIDVRYETPVNQKQAPPQQYPAQEPIYAPHPQQQQQHPHPRFNGYNPNQERFNSLQNGHNTFYQQPQQPHFAPPSSGPNRSRRSSLASNSSTFNLFKKAKDKFSGNNDFNGHDNYEDDGKDVILDQSQANAVSFNELNSIKDRGRYGGGASFDSTPIIPTMSSLPVHAGSTNSTAPISNTQYRKQITAMKKQQFTQAGKLLNGGGDDPRAMSLQSGRNPYLDQDSRAGSFTNQPPPFANGPRAYSLTNQPQYPQYGPRTNSLTNQPPPQNYGPRANSLANNQPQYGPRNNSFTNLPLQNGLRNNSSTNLSQTGGPRTNSLTNQPMHLQQQRLPHPQQKGSRAYSLNTNGNPYQQQHTGPSPPRPQGAPGAQYNNRPYGPPVANQGNRGYRNQPPMQHRNSIPGIPSPLSQSQTNLSIPQQPPHIEPVQERSIEDVQINETKMNNDTKEHSNHSLPEVERDADHHYLADNRELDDSLINSRDTSLSKEVSSIGIPNEESTPSPIHSNQQNPAYSNPEISPSKIPRSKGLPHLSLLSLGDNSDDSDDEINKGSANSTPQQRPTSQPNAFVASTEFIPRVLDPLDESKAYEARSETPSVSSEHPNFTSPPPPSSNMRQSPRRKNLMSPVRNINASQVNSRHSKNQISISSEHSIVSANPDLVNEHNKKLYGLAGNGSSSNNEAFVTASQFSVLGSRADVLDDKLRQDSDYHTYNDLHQPPPPPQEQQQQSLPQPPGQHPLSQPPEQHSLSQSPKQEKLDSPSVVVPQQKSIDKDFQNQVELAKTLEEIPHNRLGDDTEEDLDKTPVVDPSGRFSKSVYTTPLNVKRLSSESGSKSPFGKGFKSPGFLKKWTKKRDDKKKSKDVFEQIVKPIDNSVIQSNGTFESRNVSNFSEKEHKPAPISHDEDYEVTSDAAIHHTLDPQHNQSHEFNESFSRKNDLPIIPQSTNQSSIDDLKINKLGESFIPAPEKKQDSRTKSLNFTVDQLGIMENKTDLIRELELVSRELAASIKREIRLEERLKSSPRMVHSLSPSSIENSSEDRIKENASQIAELTRKLNEERKIRYIAEEHVLLHENKQEPSALKLNYEIHQLKSELAYRDELINKLQSQVEDFKNELPILKENLQKLNEINENNESVIIPNLQNEIEILSMDRKKLTIMSEKYKLLKNEKLELEKKYTTNNNDEFSYSGVNKTDTHVRTSLGNLSLKSSESKSSNRLSQINLQKPFITGSTSFDGHETTHKRLTSFSLLNVGTADS